MKHSDKGIFYFKQFKIHHDRCSHKVGTDSVLLGSWVNVGGVKSILDIGSGSGILMLMMAQRTNNHVKIDGVELDKLSAEQCQFNIKNSKWANRLSVRHAEIQNYTTNKKYDLIISNPPFFSNSHKPPAEGRTKSRHDVFLDFQSLIESCNRLSHINTKLNFVLPYEEANRFIQLASASSWFPTRKCQVRGRDHKPVERLLLEFGTKKATLSTEELCVMGQGDEWSEPYRKLTSEFYLKG